MNSSRDIRRTLMEAVRVICRSVDDEFVDDEFDAFKRSRALSALVISSLNPG